MWGPGAAGGFQNALATGLQLGQVANQQRQQNQLMQQREAMIAQRKVEFDTEQAEAARAEQIRRDAAAGKPEAVAELAGIDFNQWRALTTDQRAATKDAVDAMGQGALFVASQPPEARAAAWDQTIDGLAQRFPDLAKYKGQYSEQSLQAAISSAGQFNQFWQMTKPQEFNVGPGEGRYQRNPVDGSISTIVAPNLGGAPAFSPVATPGGNKPAPVAKQVGQATYYQNPETGQWFDNAEEAMGGGGSNVTGNFPRP